MANLNKRVEGFIHSIETGGTIDGPGIRYVVFLKGCPLRCKYCHNPDTWLKTGGKKMFVEDIVSDILKYKNFIKSGGVTISGGEPLMQAPFTLEVLKSCKENNIHTAIDTSGYYHISKCKEVFKYTDLILLDIKANDTETCKKLTGKGNENAFEVLEYACENNIPVWIRHVVVPGFTDNLEEAQKLSQRLKKYSCIKKIEILPFHKMGEYKWEKLKFKYTLKDTKEPDKNLILQIKEIFKKDGFKAP